MTGDVGILHLGFGTGTPADMMEAHSEKDMTFGSMPYKSLLKETFCPKG